MRRVLLRRGCRLHNNVERIAVFVRYGAGADGAVLALKDNMNVFGKICGNEGGKTDAEVDNIAVFKFFCNTRCDERLYLRRGSGEPTDAICWMGVGVP